MSNPLKKAVKGVKKVFKKAVQVVKKVVASKIFKVVLIAAAVYFTAGAAAGYLGAAGAAGTAGAATTAAAGTTTAAAAGGFTSSGLAAIGAIPAASVAAPTAIGTVASGISSAVSGMTVGQGLLASSVLTTGGNMLGAYAQGEKEKEAIKTLDKNGRHQVDVTGIYQDSMTKAGMVRTDEQGKTIYGQPNAPTPPAIQQVANIDPRKPSYYNSATDSWSPVQRIAAPDVVGKKSEVIA